MDFSFSIFNFIKMKYFSIFIVFVCLFFSLAFAQNLDTLNANNQESIIITGEYQPTDIRNAVHGAKIINAAEIERRGAVSLSDLLAQESNIRIQNDPILGSSMSLNGLSGRNIKFLLNGVPIVGRQNGNIDLSQINVFNIQRIEIIEGPMAILYGSDAIAGVVNIITKQYGLKKYEAQIQVRAESRAANVGSSSFTFQPNAQNSIRIGGGYNQFKGWTNDTSNRNWVWNPKQQANLQGNWTYQSKKQLKIQLFAEGMQENIQNKGEIKRPQYKPYAFDDDYMTRRVHAQFSADFPLKQKHFFSFLGGIDNYYREKNSYRTDVTTEKKDLLASESDSSKFEMNLLRALHVWKINPKWTLQSGVNVQLESGMGKRFEDSLGNKRKIMNDYALFTTLKYKVLPRFLIEGGLRAAYNTRVSIPLIPSFHAKYDFPKQNINLRASYSKGFRTPDFKELYFQFIDFNHNIIGNPDLKPENAQSFQVSLNKLKEGKNFSASGDIRLFFNDIQNKIELYEYKIVDGEKVPVTDTSTLLYTYFNVQKFQTFGTNVGAKFQYKWLKTSLNISPIAYLNPDFKSLNVAKYSFSTNIQGEISFFYAKWQTGLQTYHNWNDKQISFSEQKINGQTNTVQTIRKGYLASDIVLCQPFWKHKINASFGIKNLWNVQQITLIGTSSEQGHISDSQVNLGPGRSFWAQLSLTL